jgi:hypothetical protein
MRKYLVDDLSRVVALCDVPAGRSGRVEYGSAVIRNGRRTFMVEGIALLRSASKLTADQTEYVRVHGDELKTFDVA